MRDKQAFFSKVLADTLARGGTVRLRVQGASMLPWLREGDSVRIQPADVRRIVRGDIALYWRAPGRPILHRVVGVIEKGGTTVYECLGDAESGGTETVQSSDIIGVVVATAANRAFYRLANPARRAFNRLMAKHGIRFRHG